MAQSVPIIRAAAMAPVLRWMREHGQDVGAALSAVKLDCYATEDPLATIPLRAAVLLLRQIARVEGPDVPYRIVDGRGFYEIGLLGSIALGGETPREVFQRTAAAIPYHCSHEFLTVTEGDDGLIVDHGIHANLPDQETIHIVQQYCCALIQMVCAMTGCDEPHFSRVRMVPHPVHGFSHLKARLGDTVSKGRVLELVVPDRIADHPLSEKQDDLTLNLDGSALCPLQTNGSTSASIAFLVDSMMRTTKPSLDRIAETVGLSRRTLQRALSAEGQSFSRIVQDVRRKAALSALAGGDTALGEVSAQVGYARQSTLTRAVRRWTGQTPTALAVGRKIQS